MMDYSAMAEILVKTQKHFFPFPGAMAFKASGSAASDLGYLSVTAHLLGRGFSLSF
jgi:hypothetical protein